MPIPLGLPKGKLHSVPHHVNCQAVGVVYIMFCECGSFYIGKTKRSFWRRIKDHVYYVNSNLLYKPIGRHLNLVHSGNNMVSKFAALEHIPMDLWGGDFAKKNFAKRNVLDSCPRGYFAPGFEQCYKL